MVEARGEREHRSLSHLDLPRGPGGWMCVQMSPCLRKGGSWNAIEHRNQKNSFKEESTAQVWSSRDGGRVAWTQKESDGADHEPTLSWDCSYRYPTKSSFLFVCSYRRWLSRHGEKDLKSWTYDIETELLTRICSSLWSWFIDHFHPRVIMSKFVSWP